MRTARFLASIVAPMLIVACAVGTAPVDTSGGGGGGENDASTIIIGDGSYGGSIVDGAFVPPADASAHGGVDAGAKDSGTPITPVDSGSPITSSDECPSGNTFEYDAEWYASETSCTVGDNDCDPGDCCFDRSLGSGDPFCITP
jgi:hypothetical protein